MTPDKAGLKIIAANKATAEAREAAERLEYLVRQAKESADLIQKKMEVQVDRQVAAMVADELATMRHLVEEVIEEAREAKAELEAMMKKRKGKK